MKEERMPNNNYQQPMSNTTVTTAPNPFNTLNGVSNASNNANSTDFNALVNNMVETAINNAVNNSVIGRQGAIDNMVQNAVSKSVNKEMLTKVTDAVSKRIVNEFGFEPRALVVQSSYGKNRVNSVLVHEKYKMVLDIVGNNIPAYLYGPTGSGKSQMAKQVADGLGLPFHVMSSVTDEYKLTGFIDAGGRYHGSEFREAFENGGVFLLDEIDASAPDVLVAINAAISNNWFPFPDKTVIAHKNFRVIATGNTTGRGADNAYRGRVQLDAASLDRFVMVKVDYDKRIDKMMAMGQNDLLEFIFAYRNAITATGVVNAIASHRRVHQMAVLSTAQDPVTVLQACLLTGMNADDVRALNANINVPDSNKWKAAMNAIANFNN